MIALSLQSGQSLLHSLDEASTVMERATTEGCSPDCREQLQHSVMVDVKEGRKLYTEEESIAGIGWEVGTW